MKILVVDDELLARERLLRLLRKLVPEATLSEAATGTEALECVGSETPDLLLLDIRMPGLDGIEVARRVQALEQPPAIIFCTAYDRYALDALQQHAVAYLLKPVREEQLAEAIESASRINRLQLNALANAEGRRTHISAASYRGVDMVPLEDVRCLIAGDKYVTVHHTGGELLIPDSLKELEQEFGERLLRVHRNALVAVEHVLGLRRDSNQGWHVQLADSAIAPQVSRRHLASVKERLRTR
ncbi:response regulator transcription factor [Halieaceae bacterium IMCC14734]|uniref:Response regulator transcription factor n=1 Tax=Candidatus Litorirhabdus singularis TaxID=2518993 RepID=A0ABT3TB46_9GAMM|nr:LytTR family DNA-binding domain-containing protein [Candidatus Litorirhabdus singularis]MCX2979523.1 response regulator transcription factor [Candidatus Litorirhabdus singularis]